MNGYNPYNGQAKHRILDANINVLPWAVVLAIIKTWGENKASRYICICNVHSVVTSAGNERFREVINNADLATPDGMPLVWLMRLAGYSDQQRINGPDLMWRYCEQIAKIGNSIFLYGSTEETLARLETCLKSAFPSLVIAGAISPPFRHLSEQEDDDITEKINRSGAGVVFVGLGCPKQELWMAAHRGKINAVMIGVGAAFDYHAGTIKRAPKWMQNAGLEWFYRLASEPRRLWKRYLITNTLFVYYLVASMFRRKRGSQI